MYQGKFDSKNKKTETDVYELLAQRNSTSAPAAPVKQSAPTPAKKQTSDQKPPKQTKKAAPVEEEAPKRRGPRLGGVIFYTFYFMFILLFFVATYFGLQWLQGWLVDYEAAQPTTKSREVFDQLFVDPDWNVLYDMAGIQDTEYEGKEEFVAYMENKVGDKELTFQETSAGISGKKYVVLLEGEKIATFMLEGDSTDLLNPDWTMGAVELFYDREESYLIQLSGDHTASVNGVALDESFTIQIATTKAESSGLLPIGTAGAKVYTQRISGLMAVPTVTVVDKSGKEIPVSYDEENRTFIAETTGSVITDEEKTVALEAIKAYAEYQIKEATRQKVGQYFDSNGEAYKSIMETVLAWTKGNNGYSFANDSVTGYAKYSDSLFSVYVTTELTINLTDGGTQVKPINATLLFERQNGKWKVIRMTNADISEPVGEVRLTFMNDETVLDSKFVENDATELQTPVVSTPEGKVFAGWMTKTVNAEGKEEWNLIFTPDESGYVSIPAGSTLEPMTLYAYFENAAEEGAE